MGRIKNEQLYTLDQNVSGLDRIIGSDGDDLKKTKNFSIDDILTYFQNNNPTDYVLPTSTTIILGGVKVDGTTITIDGSGVISSSASSTGLEAINEGSGVGWRLIGRNPANYGNIGLDATDFGTSTSASSTKGATGTRAFNIGDNNIVSSIGGFAVGSNNIVSSTSAGSGNFGAHFAIGGVNNVQGYYNNMAFGAYNTITEGYSCMLVGFKNTANLTGVAGQGFAAGLSNDLTGYWSSAIGAGLVNKWRGSVSVGIGNVDSAEVVTATDRPIFIVGNGTVSSSSDASYGNTLTRSDAFRVLFNGTITAPSLSTAEIDGEATGKVLTTREWAQIGYTVATLPAGVTGRRAHVTDSNVAASGNFGTTVAGGGANIVPVFYNGTNWIIA
jgi:hypothetical protein